MEKQSRKHNRLENYDYSQNGAYFVTVCTHERKPILSTIVGDGFPVPKPIGEIAEAYIGRISEKYPLVTVDRYVIMPDHIHILLRIDGAGNPSLTMENADGTGNPSPTMGNAGGTGNPSPTMGNAGGTGNPSPTMGNVDGTGNPSPTMGNVVGWYKYQVTKQANLLLNTPGGKLFQRSYYDHVIRNQRDYDEIWQYIENNPRKWVMQP